MCGIFGFISASTTKEESLDILNKMSKTLINRGPDQYGYWHELKDGIAIGQRRLSIIDLSENGKQPMISKSGRYVITFNGMIYNFRELI